MKKTIQKLLALLLCLCLLACLFTVVFADGGDFGGDNDFGGGGGDRSGDGDGSGILQIILWLIIDSEGHINVPALVIIIIIAAIYFFLKSKPWKRKKQVNSNVAATRTAVPALRPMAEYASIDPAFHADALVQKLSNFYIQFQQSWQQKNIESLRPFFTDPYYAQLDRQLEQYRIRKMTNIVERPAVLSVELTGFTQGGGNDHIYATVKTRIVDYRIDDETGRVLSGSRTAEKFMTYRYHLIRPTGTRSDEVSGTRALSCPHCGAPLNINQSAKCPYCDSVITVEKHDFVIAQIEAISQVTA